MPDDNLVKALDKSMSSACGCKVVLEYHQLSFHQFLIYDNLGTVLNLPFCNALFSTKLDNDYCDGNKSDFPVPLATKIITLKETTVLSALTHLYHEASSKEQGKDVVIPQAPCQSTVSLQTLPQGGSSQEQVGGMLNKKLESSVQTPDQILAQNSEVLLGKSGGCLPATNFSNQFQVDNVIRSQNTSVGLARSKYLSKAYPFAGNSGKLLGNMQQPNGSVPVV
ncbi:uncharacterized protein LOC116120138 [Pistacia vera]|uniref:uncharacterized protein LOC116120138 n=1 Tax=Pistacia vera TaxID=55513 RepID=UPI001263B08F|nr:uncharacterized protein LOC116120138 [Pistacia vera]